MTTVFSYIKFCIVRKTHVSVFEIFFDIFYLSVIFSLSINLLLKDGFGASSSRIYHLAGFMSLILFFGDSFHLFPRILSFFKRENLSIIDTIGIGKQLASITITFFYVILWHLGNIIFNTKISFGFSFLIYLLALIRIILCLVPQNENKLWFIYRNIPFLFLVLVVGILFFVYRNKNISLTYGWFAILISLIVYSVFIFRRKNKSITIFIILKSISYIWLISMFVNL